jgi:DNA repair exonuclease SbcCD ATPase subunit
LLTLGAFLTANKVLRLSFNLYLLFNRNNLSECSIEHAKLTYWSHRLMQLHKIFEQQKEQIENSLQSQLQNEFTATEDARKYEIEHLKVSKDSLKQQLQFAKTGFSRLQAELKSSYALVQSKEECIEEAHMIHRFLEREAIASMEAKKHVEQLYRQFQKEKTQLEEVNQHLQNDKTWLQQVNRQHQEEKLQLEIALQECEKKNGTLQQIIDKNSPQMLSLREQNTKLMREVDKKSGYVRSLETSNKLLREKSKNFETELQEVEKASTERICGLEKDLEAEKNVRIEMGQSIASLEQQVKTTMTSTIN